MRRDVGDTGVVVDAEVVAHHLAGDEFRFAGLSGRGNVKAIQQPARDVADANEVGEIHYAALAEGTHGGVVQIGVQIREATARGQDGAANYGRCIVAFADLSAGRFQAAFDAASRVVTDDIAFTTERALPVLIEAAVRSAQRDAAESAFAVLAGRTSAAGTPWALGVRARCQALLADGNGAEDGYAEAISQLQRSHAALDLARAHLLYGQWLRRAKRRTDARHQLRTAHDMFLSMGADGSAAQAASELRATGERARSRTPETELDPMRRCAVMPEPCPRPWKDLGPTRAP